MHIRHVNPATDKLGVEGHEFAAVRPGVFDVPDEIGYQLLQHGVWARYTGEEPYEVSVPVPSGATPAGRTDATPEEAGHQQAEAGEPDWFEEGRKAAEARQERKLPEGIGHARSRDARAFLDGYDSHRPEEPPETVPAE